jgi:hypothetical protein
MYGDMSRTLQGQMSRKYCDECNILQGEDHRRNEYARKKQLMEIKQ